MKIFVSFLQSKYNHDIPAYDFWIYYIRNGLREEGYEIIESEIDWAYGLLTKDIKLQSDWKDEVWTKAIATCRAERPKIFLSYLYPNQILPDAIHKIKEMGILCVNFFCDNVRNFRKVPLEFYCFSLHWVPEFEALPMYRAAGLKTVNAPMPMWIEPKCRKQITDGEELDQISFIGSKDILRARLFKDALKKGVSLRIMGAGWQNEIKESANMPITLNPYRKLSNQWQQIQDSGLLPWLRKFSNRIFYPMPTDESFLLNVDPKPDFATYVDLTRRSKIVLGVNRYPCNFYSYMKPNTYSRLRDIEAPMLGACYLTEYVEGIEQLYEPGKEIETYRNVEELEAKIHQLSNDRVLRAKLRLNGQRRALHEHSIDETLRKIIKAL